MEIEDNRLKKRLLKLKDEVVALLRDLPVAGPIRAAQRCAFYCTDFT